MGSGVHDVSEYEWRGLQPPRQEVPDPQNPYSEQQGAEAGQSVPGPHVDWALAVDAIKPRRRGARRVRDIGRL